ncbi:MAG: DmsE family decaheme c-type cytochrome [Rhodomicrobium sp.]
MAAVAGIVCGIVLGFNAPAKANDLEGSGGSIAALRANVQLVSTAQADTRAGASSTQAATPAARGPKLADADSLFGAFNQLMQRQEGPAPSDKYAAPVPPAGPVGESPRPGATLVGSKTCLGCHAPLGELFSHTLMGRLHTQGKLECETCHGPASVHVRSVGCASCHGEGGVSTRSGIPSLVGQDPLYLDAAMKEYVTGHRKNSVMQGLLTGVGESEREKIALYYARQTPAPAQTPLVGDPSAGRGDIAVCAGCHGEHGVSVGPGVPSLAGQDSKYLAGAIRAYRQGTREKVIACATCHGEHGISRTPGTPSLVGMDAQYLVTSMREYANGHRKNAVMRALLSGVGEGELEGIAAYYAAQTPARAHTPARGDASAGRTAGAACAGCHGEHGVSANPAWPSLAGQDSQYLAAALRAYKDGLRSDATMKGMASSLDNRTIEDLAAYYASLAPAKPSGSGYAAKREPVLVRNQVVANLDERTINDIAAYFASQPPAQPAVARNGAGDYVPRIVGGAMPANGESVGGIISFRKDDLSRTPEENNAICLNCHERGERAYWKGSVHQVRNVACTNCHTIMKTVSAKNQLKTAFEPETCFQCHKDRRAQMFRSSHMPMREGKIVCSNCHNPHGSVTEKLIRENSVNENCYKCHAEKRGPYLFEHAPVRENCLTCHDPHGSINEASLKLSRPRLCFECHALGGHGPIARPNQSGATPPNNFGNAQVYAVGRACNNCHTLIHGSNSPAGAFLQR